MRVLAAVLGLLLFAGCGGGAAVSADALRGTPWTLTSGIDVAGWEAVAPSLRLDGGTASGSSGCNRFTAAYTLDGEALRIEGLAGTRMACDEPARSAESAFLAALPRVAGWRISDDVLILRDDDGGELLRFAPASVTGDWEVTAFLHGGGVSTLVQDSTITASFAPDGKLTGSGGCNTYQSTYETGQGTITIDAPAVTEMACSDPDGVMEQEQSFVTVLPTATAYTVEGGTLTLLTVEGTIVATLARR